MTAPLTDEEIRLKRFELVKPSYTGLAIPPDDFGRDNRWWFPYESAVERYEEHHRRLFCRDCMVPHTVGHQYAPIMVDFEKDPLGSVVALAETCCSCCHKTQIYPVREAYELHDEAVSLRVYGYRSLHEKREVDLHQAQLEALHSMRNQAAFQNVYGYGGIGGHAQTAAAPAPAMQAHTSNLAGAGSGQTANTLFNRAVAALGKKIP